MTWAFPYPSQRMPVLADNIVATSQPLAVQAGLDILRQGGNAVDAAIATAIALTVVEPTSNGLGSDAFAAIWNGNELICINGSGRSPRAWKYEHFAGLDQMPTLGWQTVTVPGAVSVWMELSKKFGVLPFDALFNHAIEYAENGFPVSPITAAAWQKAQSRYQDFPEFQRVFLPHGKSPAVGERFYNRTLATTLRGIASSQGEIFYRGRLADLIAQEAEQHGALLTIQDLAEHQPEWVKPLSVDYYGVTLHELPPNGQGLAALIALGILAALDINQYEADSVDSIHLQIEAMKVAFDAVSRYLADPQWMTINPASLLNEKNIQAVANKIQLQQAQQLTYEVPGDHGTVYLSTADKQGMMVSFIQSNYMGFGSGVVIPGTGISLQNRGNGFSTQQGHPNQVDGGKRPFHTIIPAFVTQNGQPILSFGVMGGRMQAQGHVQMMVRLFNYQQNPQAASDAPRWCVMQDGRVALEPEFPTSLLDGLQQRGHTITTDEERSLFGGAQLIMKHNDSYIGASDHRKDGLAAGF